jgi:hypothetical protein
MEPRKRIMASQSRSSNSQREMVLASLKRGVGVDKASAKHGGGVGAGKPPRAK